jgi:hypothetical protein
MKNLLREKYPHKSEVELAKEMDIIKNTKIEDWLWKKMIIKIYDDEEDVQSLMYSFKQLQKSK